MLQSYILSTTTETVIVEVGSAGKCLLQSYILSTTTETLDTEGKVGKDW